jgi:hypothetical protein
MFSTFTAPASGVLLDVIYQTVCGQKDCKSVARPDPRLPGQVGWHWDQSAPRFRDRVETHSNYYAVGRRKDIGVQVVLVVAVDHSLTLGVALVLRDRRRIP